MGAQVCEQVRVELVVLQGDPLCGLTEGFLAFGPHESIRVEGLLAFKLNLTTGSLFDFLGSEDQLLDDAVESQSTVGVDLTADSHNDRVMAIILDAEAVERQ